MESDIDKESLRGRRSFRSSVALSNGLSEYTSFDGIKFPTDRASVSGSRGKVESQEVAAQEVNPSVNILSSFIKKVKDVLVPTDPLPVAESPKTIFSNTARPKSRTIHVSPLVNSALSYERSMNGNQRKKFGIMGYTSAATSTNTLALPRDSDEFINERDQLTVPELSLQSSKPNTQSRRRKKEGLFIISDCFDDGFISELSQEQNLDLDVPSLQKKPVERLSSDESSYPTKRRDSTAASLRSANTALRQNLFKARRTVNEERTDYWMRDEISKECHQCKLPFTTFRRRHHCRVCGQVFCGKCAGNIVPGERLGLQRDIRTCDYCYKMLLEYQNTHHIYEASEPATPMTSNNTLNVDVANIPNSLQQWARTYSFTSESTIAPSASANISIPSTNVSIQNNSSQTANSFDSFRKFFTTSGTSFARLFNQSGHGLPSSPLATFPSHQGRTDMIERLEDLPFRYVSQDDDGLPDSEDESLVDETIRPLRGRELGSLSEESDSSNTPKDSLVHFLSSQNVSTNDKKRRRRTEENKRIFASTDMTKAFDIATSLIPPANKEDLAVSAPSSPLFSKKLSIDVDVQPALLEGQAVYSSSYLQSSGVPVLQLNTNALDFVRKFLKQVLSQYAIQENADQWEDEIMKLMMKVCYNVKPHVRQGDDIDIRKYVKIKKILGGAIDSSEFVSGVVFSKNVLHKHMLRKQVVNDPKILLVGFPLVYDRAQEKRFTSLETVLQQEREYLYSLIHRMSELKPDVILCEKEVSGVALEYLLEFDIICCSNVKPQIMEAVSRCTNTEICKSLDRITLSYNHLKLGTCGRFYVKTFYQGSGEGKPKTVIYFDDCVPEKGCTIILRGGSSKAELQKIKRVADLLTLVNYNMMLESGYLRDDGRQPIYSFLDNSEFLQDGLLFEIYLAPYRSVALSISPTVTFPSPYLLDRMVKKEISIRKSDDVNLINVLNQDYEKFKQYLLRQTEDEDSYQKFEPSIDLPEDILDGLNYILSHTNQALSPFHHQNLLILYCNINIATRLPCHPPDIHLIQYYNKETDMALGQYLEELCFDSNYFCPSPQCGDNKSMLLHHFRSYVHGNYRLNVRINQSRNAFTYNDGVVYMYSFCKSCDSLVTPLIPMSDLTWNYSFGKFLEMRFYGSQPLGAGSVQIKSATEEPVCKHKQRTDVINSFILNNLSVTFDLELIRLFELVRPSLMIRLTNVFELKEHECATIRIQIVKFFASVEERLQIFGSIIQKLFSFSETDWKSLMPSFHNRLYSNKSRFLIDLFECFGESSESDLLCLNKVRLNFHMCCIEWDQEFLKLARKLLILIQDKVNNYNALNKEVDGKEEKELPLIITTTQFEQWKASIKSSPISDPRNKLKPESPTDDLNIKKRSTWRASVVLEDLESDIKAASIEIMKDTEQMFSLLNQEDAVEDTVLELPDIRPDSPDRNEDEEVVNRENSIKNADREAFIRSFLEESREVIFQIKNTKELLQQAVQLGFIDERLVKIPYMQAQGSGGPSSVSPSTSYWMNSTPKQITTLLTPQQSSILFDNFDFNPLDYGVKPTDHFMLDSNIIIREDEPTSMIAYMMNSFHYQNEMRNIKQASQDIQSSLLSKSGSHIKYEFSAGNLKCYCRAYFAEQFDAVRELTGSNEFFIQSLASCSDFKAKGGQSRSMFFKTKDDRFILKQLSKPEMEAFLGFATSYFAHLDQVFFHDLPSVLVKLLGVYRIGYKTSADSSAASTLSALGTSTGPTNLGSSFAATNVKIDLVVMENLFYRRSTKNIFDLKGSMRNRHVQSTGMQNEVLLDQNLMEIMGHNPLFIREHSKRILRASVWNDTLFLSRQNVMDYSLLVGIDENSSELIVGIVDFIRTFTWDKKLESWVKETGILGGGGKEPTIVSPRLYKNRFREAMERYFLMVPDKFCDISTVINKDAAGGAFQE